MKGKSILAKMALKRAAKRKLDEESLGHEATEGAEHEAAESLDEEAAEARQSLGIPKIESGSDGRVRPKRR